MQKELEKLIYEYIMSNGTEGGGGDYFIGKLWGARNTTQQQFTELTKEICKFYNLDYSDELRKYIQYDLCDGERLFSYSDWVAEYIHKKIIELNLKPDNDNRGAASIMDTGLFDFKQK